MSCSACSGRKTVRIVPINSSKRSESSSGNNSSKKSDTNSKKNMILGNRLRYTGR